MIEFKLKANNCNRRQLFRPCWVSSVRCSKLWSIQLVDWYPYTHYKMAMTSDETRIQILANWPMSHAKRVTWDNRKNPEYHVVAAIRKLQTDRSCVHWQHFRLRSFASSCLLSSIFWGRRSFQIRYAAHFLTWFGHDFPAGQFVSVRSFLRIEY